jgi:anthranilate synthase component 1
MKYKHRSKKLIADLYTPVGCYLKLRQKYHQVLLLESSDYSSKQNSRSYIFFNPQEGIQILDNQIFKYNKGDKKYYTKDSNQVLEELKSFTKNIQVDNKNIDHTIVGYSNYESIEYFETIKLNRSKAKDDVPTMRYDFYRYMIIIDHYHDNMEIHEYNLSNQKSELNSIELLLNYKDVQTFDFKLTGEEKSNIDDEKYISNIRTAKSHLQNGDIFQIVLSRSFQQSFSGDVFNVYRTLRTINPSPYLYFFDYGSYKIFGSSPEAQVSIKGNKAEIHPIAGTFKRSGDQKIDAERAEELKADPKENAEHVMLVDLARNDLSKHSKNVYVKKYKEIQYFSHVIHLTSIVEGTLNEGTNALDIYADTFPAGTLTGTPKYKAMEIIDKLETTSRGFYGGAIGMIGLSGNINQAILIRSFIAKGKLLRYQSGAGIVIDSDEKNELQEVHNKLAALKVALKKAEEIS